MVTYCTRECQARHWPEHKSNCKAIQQAKKEMNDKDRKRECRLWLSWNEDAPIQDIVISHFGASEVEGFHEKMGIALDTAFDYNRRNFVPTGPPRLIPLIMIQLMESCEQPIVKKGRLVIKTEYTDDKNKGMTHFCHFPLEGLSALKTYPADSSWEEKVELSFPRHATPIQSAIFDSWEPLRNQNLRQQVQLIRYSSHYVPFILNALHIGTTQPRHKTHVVMVYIKMGFGLGQIDEVTKYQVLTLNEAKQSIQKKYKSVP
jgi:MYND finger